MTGVMGDVVGDGVIGAKTICERDLRHAIDFAGIAVRAVADLDPAAAAARAQDSCVRAETVEGKLAAADIDVVVSLTVPAAHREVPCANLAPGKHAFWEKPLALTHADAGPSPIMPPGMTAGSVPRRTPSAAAATRDAAVWSTQAPRAGSSIARAASCRRRWSTGIRTRVSSLSRAAARSLPSVVLTTRSSPT